MGQISRQSKGGGYPPSSRLRDSADRRRSLRAIFAAREVSDLFGGLSASTRLRKINRAVCSYVSTPLAVEQSSRALAPQNGHG